MGPEDHDMKYAVICISNNSWQLESDDLARIRRNRAALKRKGMSTVLVRILESDEDDELPELDPDTALDGIIQAANGNPEPIHYKVRQAIDDARRAL